MQRSRIQYERCRRHTTYEPRYFQFNISTKHPNQWQLLDKAAAETRSHLHGRVKVSQGKESQYSDIEIRAELSSNNEADLNRIVLRDSEFALNMDYNLDNSIAKADLCTEVEIFISLRPNRTVDLFEIRSNILDIDMGLSLNWTVYNLITYTSYGGTQIDSLRASEERLIAYNVSAGSTYGFVALDLMAPEENLEVWSEDGGIYIEFWPDLYNWKPLDLNSISLSTLSGDIRFLSSFSVPWPKGDYTYRLSVSTDSGSIRSQAPHGLFTNYSSNSGDIACYLRPYGTTDPNTKNEIYTTTQSGNLLVRISEAFEAGNGRYNPNSNSISKHLAENGIMKLRYSYDWLGELEAEIGNGYLDFDSSLLEDAEWGEGYVKARRGKGGESHMNAHVGNGKLDIKLGLGL